MSRVIHVKKGIPMWYILNAGTIHDVARRAEDLSHGKFSVETTVDALCFFGIIADNDNSVIDWKRMLTDEPIHFMDFIDYICELRRNSIVVDA